MTFKASRLPLRVASRAPFLVAAASLVTLLLVIPGCGKDSGPQIASDASATPDEGALPDAGPATEVGFHFVSPLAGDLVEPGDTIDISLTASSGLVPTLLIGDVDSRFTFMPDAHDPTLLHTRFTVPMDAAGTIEFVATSTGALADFTSVKVAVPMSKSTVAIGAADTAIMLPSGAKLTIPKDAVTGGGMVTFSSFDPATTPVFTGANLLGPIHRIHLSADETRIAGPMFIDEPLSAKGVAGLEMNIGEVITLEVYEGDDPDPEQPPMSVRADLILNQDGTGTVHAVIPADAFHHTGSSAAIFGISGKRYPYTLDNAKVCTSNDADNGVAPNCANLQQGLNAAKVKLSCSGDATTAHVKLTGSVAWKDNPPALASPLPADPIPTSPFNALRKLNQKFRPHEGNDLRAPLGTLVTAAAPGMAFVEMGNQFHVDIDVDGANGGPSKWMLRSLHLRNFLGFTHDFKKDEVIGKNWDGVTVKAPSDGTYGLACEEKHKNGNEVAVCQLQLNGQPLIDAMHPNNYRILQLARGLFSRHVSLGDSIGESGSTGLPSVSPHLHFEVVYAGSGAWGTANENYRSGTPVDVALFYSSVSDDQSVNEGDTSRVQSPVMRFAAQLDPGNGANGGISGTILGVGAATLHAGDALCPYGAMDKIDPGKYALVKMGGPKEMTAIDWDLGGCVFLSTCDPNMPKDVPVRLGTTTWRYRNEAMGMRPWDILSEMPLPAPNMPGYFQAPAQTITHNVWDANGALVSASSDVPQASDFEGMTVHVDATAEFPASTMTITKVTLVGTPNQYVGTFGGPEAGNPSLSGTLPMNAIVFEFGDNMQPAGVVGFPPLFNGKNFANRNGRSNLIAVWKDKVKGWQWVWNVSGGSYNSNGGFPQWHEYQFIYDSRLAANMRTRYDVYLGANAMAGGWNYIRTLPTVDVVTRKKTSYVLPDAAVQ